MVTKSRILLISATLLGMVGTSILLLANTATSLPKISPTTTIDQSKRLPKPLIIQGEISGAASVGCNKLTVTVNERIQTGEPPAPIPGTFGGSVPTKSTVLGTATATGPYLLEVPARGQGASFSSCRYSISVYDTDNRQRYWQNRTISVEADDRPGYVGFHGGSEFKPYGNLTNRTVNFKVILRRLN